MLISDQHKITKDIKNVLIIQLGDIGDVVWATPSFRAVKEAFSQAHVSVLLREGAGCLLEADPCIDKIFEIKQYHGGLFRKLVEQMRFIKALRQEHFDLVFDLRSDDRGAFMARLTGAPMRGSLYYQDVSFWRNRLFTHLLVETHPPNERVLGAAEQSLRILRGFGIDVKETVPKLRVSDEVMKKAQEMLPSKLCLCIKDNGGINWITVNPFSRWSYKEWAYHRWAEVINWLWKEYEIAAVIVGAPSEKSKAAELTHGCSEGVYNLAGMTTLAELAGLLSLSALHIGVDSAAPHIAAAVGTPTITIYGPSDWRDWAPVGNQHRVIVPDMDCVPCQKKGCDGLERSRCLETLEADKVQKVIREELKKRLM
jgi:predicted lipopolysaccharide heptosyltransferase III